MKAKLKKKSREEIADPHTAIYHFKIYLLNISPMIYRRFKIKGDTHKLNLTTLLKLLWVGIMTICIATVFKTKASQIKIINLG